LKTFAGLPLICKITKNLHKATTKSVDTIDIYLPLVRKAKAATRFSPKRALENYLSAKGVSSSSIRPERFPILLKSTLNIADSMVNR
jgi:hypothetical protein